MTLAWRILAALTSLVQWWWKRVLLATGAAKVGWVVAPLVLFAIMTAPFRSPAAPTGSQLAFTTPGPSPTLVPVQTAAPTDTPFSIATPLPQVVLPQADTLLPTEAPPTAQPSPTPTIPPPEPTPQPVAQAQSDPAHPTLQRGASGASVAELQRRLDHWIADAQPVGLTTISTDGTFGPRTDAAVRAFQQAQGLSVDGIVGRQTWQALPADVPSASSPVRIAPPAAPTTAPVPAAHSGSTAPQGYTCPAGYPVKGNINTSRGTRIYHVPGDRYYDRTKPEQCFATAADAEAAGYRAPLQ